MNDAYVQMIVDERNKLKISTTELCEGVYTADMFYLVEQGKRDISRTISERLLSRLGVDSGNYEHYLDYPDYETWKSRMKIINIIEDNRLVEARKLLDDYAIYYIDTKNSSRVKFEKQFVIFMELQIIKHTMKANETEDLKRMYEEAVKLTVPNIDKKPLKKLLLSQVELVLVLEHKRRKYANASVHDKWKIYEEIFAYLQKSPLGKLSMVRVYPKIFVSMYRDIAPMISTQYDENAVELHEGLFKYCEEALRHIQARKLIYYLTEILEIKLELLSWFEKNKVKLSELNMQEVKEETAIQLEELKGLYEEYGIDCYMVDDCYIYRESGVYCINEVVKTRREMMDISRAQLGGTDIEASTIWRIETENKAVTHKVANKLFERLNLYPSCINTGIVADKKQALELYEELRYAIIAFKFDEVKKLIKELEHILPEHVINRQVLLRIESQNELRMGNVDKEEHTNMLMKALESTIKLSHIQEADKIFLTTQELTILYLLSAGYKGTGEYEKALIYIKEIVKYCKDFEKEDIVDGRIGIYEMVMAYMSSLYGDMGRYDESNNISESLIRMCLRLRRGNRMHFNMYNIAWNNVVSKKHDYDYSAQVQRCINISKLLGDIYDEKFYYEHLETIE